MHGRRSSFHFKTAFVTHKMHLACLPKRVTVKPIEFTLCGTSSSVDLNNVLV